MILATLLLAATFSRPLERVSTTDPAEAQSAYDARVVQLIYESPLAIDYKARPYQLAPGYCELPEVSPDGRVYRFTVREAPRNAADMVRSLKRLYEPTCPNGWLVKDVESVAAADARTVEIRLKRRVRHFPWLMATPGACVVGADGSGTGPYVLTKWRKNHEMVFERKASSAAAAPSHFDFLRYLVIDDMSTQWLMFLRGEVDFLGEISRDNWDMVVGADGRLVPELAAKGVRLHMLEALESPYVGFNMRDPVVGGNRKLRQALNCAFDYPAWERFYNRRISESRGPVPPGVSERVDAPLPYRFDLVRAKRLLAEAGYPDGIDPKTGRRLVLTLAIGRPDQSSREMGELMASFFERIGVKLELSFMTWDAFMTAVNESRVQMYYMIWVLDYPDAQNILQLFYGPNRSPGVNHSNYENPEYDAAFEREDYIRCQEIVREDCPWIYTHYRKESSLTGPRVGNFVPSDFPYGNEQHFEYVDATPSSRHKD